jgi:hypothetical protein
LLFGRNLPFGTALFRVVVELSIDQMCWIFRRGLSVLFVSYSSTASHHKAVLRLALSTVYSDLGTVPTFLISLARGAGKHVA